jgi:hypothetical protein
MEEIQKLTEEQAKALLHIAVDTFRCDSLLTGTHIENRRYDFIANKIKTLSKENAEK